VPRDQRPDGYDAYLLRDAYGGAKHPESLVWKDGEEPETWTFFDELLIKQLNKLWIEHEGEQINKKQKNSKKAIKNARVEDRSNGWDEESEDASDI